MKLWEGRFQEELNRMAHSLNRSLPFDQRMAAQDVCGSIAWVNALQGAGLLTPAESAILKQCLKEIGDEMQGGGFVYLYSDEDIHTAVERRLGEKCGDLAGKLHTGRSRNDQVSTDFRLWVKDAAAALQVQLKGLQKALLARAEVDFGIVLPGYTHTQPAQPVLFSHWWLSHFWALQRDCQRLKAVSASASTLPLGSAALAGCVFNVDRHALAHELGFTRPSPNSLDAVADRDFAAEFLFWAAMTGVHLSRLADALILFSTREFAFLSMSDAYTTGSSLMPQKKNPDILELVRGKSGILTGKLTGLLTTLKGLPSAYDKDLQEDKQPVFEACDILNLLLPVMASLLEGITVQRERCRQAVSWDMLATDLADDLVRKGVPFRQAHHAVGRAVRRAEELGMPLPHLPLEEWQAVHPAFDNTLYELFDVERSLDYHAIYGGTAPSRVREQMVEALRALEES